MCPNYKPAFEKHLRQKTRNSFNYEHLKRADEKQLPRVALDDVFVPAALVLSSGQRRQRMRPAQGLKRSF